jgi:hypothetical protein
MSYTDSELFGLIQASMQALSPHYAVARDVFQEYQIDGHDWFHCNLAHGLEPQPVSAAVLNAIYPYVPLERRRARLADTGRAWLPGPRRGRLLPPDRAGRAAVEAFFSTAQQALAQVSGLEGVDTTRLVDLLVRIVSRIQAAPEPPVKGSFQASRRTDPGPQAPILARFDQAVTDLYYFRDDAHLAAWKPTGVSGPVWEALSFIWEGHYADLAERQEGRGLDDAERRAVLDELIQRGWIAPEGEGYRCTEAGRKLRQAAEDETNRLYFAPWSAALDEAGRQTLGDLLTALNERLTALAEARDAAAASQ